MVCAGSCATGLRVGFAQRVCAGEVAQRGGVRGGCATGCAVGGCLGVRTGEPGDGREGTRSARAEGGEEGAGGGEGRTSVEPHAQGQRPPQQLLRPARHVSRRSKASLAQAPGSQVTLR
jgi:hypothetical protein